jgi:hypothetical protein
MRSVSGIITTGIAMMMAAGCSSAAAEPEDGDEDGFTLIAHDATHLEAVYRSGGASVHATLVERAAKLIEVTYDFGDPVIGFSLDHNQGVGQFMPIGNPLDAAQARLITPLLAELSNLVPPLDSDRTMVEDAAIRQTSFMEIVPVGEILVPYQFVSERGWVHISCTCGSQFIGSGFTRIAGKGCGCTGGSGNGCKGRCGQGCGGTSTPPCVGTTAYTQDCALHDYGLGSFAAASDDFAFASNNCSCSGTSACF